MALSRARLLADLPPAAEMRGDLLRRAEAGKRFCRRQMASLSLRQRFVACGQEGEAEV